MKNLDRKRTLLDLTIVLLLLLQIGPGCGRTLSRWGIGEQRLQTPVGTREVLSIAFHKVGESTVKDVLFLMDDCTVVAQEYKDVSPFEGELTFVDPDGKPFKQGGCVPKTPSTSG